jgi:hypothetical protein
VAVTVKVYVPAGVFVEVVIVNVDVQVGLQEKGLNEGVAPEGNPETDNETV